MKYTIQTKMTKEECIEYTRNNLPKFGFHRKSKYIGSVNNKGFKITINPSTDGLYKINSFKPVNVGTFEEVDGSVVINVKQRVSLPICFVAIGMSLFLAFVLCVMTIAIIYEKDYASIPFLGIPLLFVIIIVAGIIGGLKYYSKKDMEEVKKLYEGK